MGRRLTHSESAGQQRLPSLAKAHGNQGLFSDHYLQGPLKQLGQWRDEEGVEGAYERLREKYAEVKRGVGSLSERGLRDDFISPVLRILGHALEPDVPAPVGGATTRPDYAFFGSEVGRREAREGYARQAEYFTRVLALGEAKPWGVDLDRKWGAEVSPATQICNYLYHTGVAWGILTNGCLWRLYEQSRSRRVENFYEVNLLELLGSGDLEAFKYFWLFFRRQAFEKAQDGRFFLDVVLQGSTDYAVALGGRLKENVYEALRQLMLGFFALNSNGLRPERDLHQVHAECLVLLYRLLFVLYAESSGLMPVGNQLYKTCGLESLKKAVASNLDDNQQLGRTICTLWPRLQELFAIVERGNEEIGVPAYNGGLFRSGANRILDSCRIGDGFLAGAIDLIARDSGDGVCGFVDYRELGVRHLGSIYEGLLELKPQMAKRPMVEVRRGRKILVVQEAEAAGEQITGGRARRFHRGEVYLVTDRGERKATGSYYTPEYIVNYIVDKALGPLVAEAQRKVAQLRPEVDKEVQRLEGEKEMAPAERRAEIEHDIARQKSRLLQPYLSLKVLDPAMGSGHFLVQAADFIGLAMAADGNLHAPEELGVQQAARGGREGAEIGFYRRLAVEHCLYGVDLNPLAVELAKLSLWLSSAAKGKALSFLDHHLRCGDSLIGAQIKDLDDLPEKRKGRVREAEAEGAPRLIAPESFEREISLAVQALGKLEEIPSETAEDIRRKEQFFRERVQAHVERYKAVADLWCSAWFENNMGPHDYQHTVEWLQTDHTARRADLPPELHKYLRNSRGLAKTKHFFHWELEFPELFFTEDGKHKREESGFDAVVGNPPYDVLPESDWASRSSAAGCANLAGHFIVRGAELTGRGGSFGFVVPLSFSCGADFEGVRQVLYSQFGELRATHYSIRPASLFPGVDQRNTIFAALSYGSQPCEVSSSRLYRFRRGQEEEVVMRPVLGQVGVLSAGHIPRVADEVGAGLYRKLLALPERLRDTLAPAAPEGQVSWWLHTVGRYWVKAYDFKPYFARGGVSEDSTTLRQLAAPSGEVALAAVGVINSDVFYFWWMTQCDEFHVLLSEVLSFPVPRSLFTDSRFLDATSRLMDDYRSKAIRKTLRVGGHVVEMDEIHARLSRNLILELDELLAPHYGLTPEELRFIQIYDEEFRVGGEDDD